MLRFDLVVTVAKYQNGKGQHQDSPGDGENGLIGHLFDIDGQQSGQGGYRDIDQELHWQSAGLEIDADHGTQFQVDEKQQDIFEGCMAVVDHLQVGHHARPDHRGADHEQAYDMEGLYQVVSQFFDDLEALRFTHHDCPIFLFLIYPPRESRFVLLLAESYTANYRR